jgi:tetratricopeptide (TPR) repeat protein
MDVRQAMLMAAAMERTGNFAEAERFYRQVLSHQPVHPQALHRLGVVASCAGRLDAGIDYLQQAIAIEPENAYFHSDLGNALCDRHRIDDAISEFRYALRLNPNYAEAHNNLGVALRAKGLLSEAIGEFRHAIRLNEKYPDAINNLGIALRDAGLVDEAIAAYRNALQIQPAFPEAHNNLGVALRDRGMINESIAAFRAAIRLQPRFAEPYANLGNALCDLRSFDEAIDAYNNFLRLQPQNAPGYSNLGNALRGKGLPDEAIAAYLQALKLNPDFAEAHSNLGNALRQNGSLQEAVSAHRRAIELKPAYADGYSNLADALHDLGQIDEAVSAYRQAIQLNSNPVEAHYGLANCLLLRGEFSEGWIEYEWRWRWKDFPSQARQFARPRWDGSPLNGRKILLHCEQGLGDTIQFVRYALLIAQRGGKVIIECQPELGRLLDSLPVPCEIATFGQILPSFDVYCPLLSLPAIMGTTLSTIPAAVPYLSCNPRLVELWKSTIECSDASIKVGLAWAGNPEFKGDRSRSMKLASLAPLANVRGVKFYSLQKGEAGKQANDPPAGLHLVDLGAQLTDFADTAAAISLMDLVITTDTSVAHLAGAMGKPVWVMLELVPNFRWLLERTDSPWYPTMQLFRQNIAGGWNAVIDRVSSELSIFRSVIGDPSGR